jgi:hemerythrin-like domain-containing protein
MDLTTNGVVITDAIKYVQGQMQHLNNQENVCLQDVNENNEESEKQEQQEQRTHNGVF